MTATAAPESIRRRLAYSRLSRAGGVAVSELLDDAELRALATEAAACVRAAEAYQVDRHDGEEQRGGSPERRLASAAGGGVLNGLYRSARLRGLLAHLTGVEWRPSGAGGSYSYYCRPGDHLGIHRDVDECDLAAIVCVYDRPPRDDALAGTLCVYPGRLGEPLSAIRAAPDAGQVPVRLRPGEIAVLLGGLVPHRVLPVATGQVRVVAPLCFSAVALA